MLIISLEEPEYVRSAKILSLMLLEIFEYIQATPSTLLVIQGGHEFCRRPGDPLQSLILRTCHWRSPSEPKTPPSYPLRTRLLLPLLHNPLQLPHQLLKLAHNRLRPPRLLRRLTRRHIHRLQTLTQPPMRHPSRRHRNHRPTHRHSHRRNLNRRLCSTRRRGRRNRHRIINKPPSPIPQPRIPDTPIEPALHICGRIHRPWIIHHLMEQPRNRLIRLIRTHERPTRHGPVFALDAVLGVRPVSGHLGKILGWDGSVGRQDGFPPRICRRVGRAVHAVCPGEVVAQGGHERGDLRGHVGQGRGRVEAGHEAEQVVEQVV